MQRYIFSKKKRLTGWKLIKIESKIVLPYQVYVLNPFLYASFYLIYLFVFIISYVVYITRRPARLAVSPNSNTLISLASYIQYLADTTPKRQHKRLSHVWWPAKGWHKWILRSNIAGTRLVRSCLIRNAKKKVWYFVISTIWKCRRVIWKTFISSGGHIFIHRWVGKIRKNESELNASDVIPHHFSA